MAEMWYCIWIPLWAVGTYVKAEALLGQLKGWDHEAKEAERGWHKDNELRKVEKQNSKVSKRPNASQIATAIPS
jgi:hypothetical protein